MKLKILPLCVFKSSQFLLLRGKTMGLNTYVLLKGTDLNTHLPWAMTSNSFQSPFGANSCSLHEAFHIHIQAPSVSSTVSPAPCQQKGNNRSGVGSTPWHIYIFHSALKTGWNWGRGALLVYELRAVSQRSVLGPWWCCIFTHSRDRWP